MRPISHERIGEYLQTAFKILDENGGQFPVRDIFSEMAQRLDFTDHERQRYEKTGYVRWQSVTHFYSIDCAKAGWLRKQQGVWYLTDDGREALKMPAKQFIETAIARFREWRRRNKDIKTEEKVDVSEEEIQEDRTASYEQAVATAREEIEGHIKRLDPYAFQDFVAALLRGMGYYTPFVAPKGPDKGVDIIAYKDPLGAETPRVKVQVKHRSNDKVSRKEVAELHGILKKDEMGIIVSSSGFTPDAILEVRNASTHIESIDRNQLIDLWGEYYERLSEEDKQILPLKRIWFLAPEQ